MKARIPAQIMLLVVWILSACSPVQPSVIPADSPPSMQPAQPATATLPATPKPAPTVARFTLSLDPSLPRAVGAALRLPELVQLGNDSSGDLRLALAAPGDKTAPVTWVYALAAPFPTLIDGLSSSELRAAWRQKPDNRFGGRPILVSQETLALLSAAWGAPCASCAQAMPEKVLLDAAWKNIPTLAILPFDQLGPRWKLLHVDGISLFERSADLNRYPLAFSITVTGAPPELLAAWPRVTNRDLDRLTTLIMTGTTALVRGTAEKMDEKGILYPAAKIGALLRSADLTHISNEVSFDPACPPPARRDPNFCSDPDYIRLLDAIGVDVVELTGNHVLDRGQQPFLDTLAAYARHGWNMYGGGKNLETAQQALTLVDHGNRLAFIGCNASGPQSDWATLKQAGSAPCDFDPMRADVQRLRAQGYLVIATFQHVEVCSFEPHLAQKADFQKLVDAGAVIVSGSQAHCPQSMAFSGESFVHYGLGNLFFDQMDDFSRRQFIDRHVFYDGQYLGVELITTKLEDAAQPVLMNAAERQKLLEDAFRASGWIR